MIGGLTLLQVVKCFRDEDLRADRQPEFTQLDLKCLPSPGRYFHVIEQVLVRACAVAGSSPSALRAPALQDVISKYGSDKPDLRSAWNCMKSVT